MSYWVMTIYLQYQEKSRISKFGCIFLPWNFRIFKINLPINNVLNTEIWPGINWPEGYGQIGSKTQVTQEDRAKRSRRTKSEKKSLALAKLVRTPRKRLGPRQKRLKKIIHCDFKKKNKTASLIKNILNGFPNLPEHLISPAFEHLKKFDKSVFNLAALKRKSSNSQTSIAIYKILVYTIFHCWNIFEHY